jgi:thioester reductase-like protein
VICLVRCPPHVQPLERIRKSLKARALDVSEESLSRRVCGVAADFRDALLGCPQEVIKRIRTSQSLIIHAAWEVNFNLPVASFEVECIAGTKHLLDLALSVQAPHFSRFIFCSSISTATNYSLDSRVPEDLVNNISCAQSTGYARSKWIAENIVSGAATKAGADVRILRIGQIVGDCHNGIWNPNEAIPLMIRSASIIKVLPALQEQCSWLPVDLCACTVLELSGIFGLEQMPSDFLPPSPVFYNVLHPRTFDWTLQLLPKVRAAGIEFETVEPLQWLRLLEGSAVDPVVNPSLKLLSFWKKRYGNPETAAMEGREMAYDTAKAQHDSTTLREARDCIETRLIDKFVHIWKNSWQLSPSEDKLLKPSH